MAKEPQLFTQLKDEHEKVKSLLEKALSCDPDERQMLLEEIEENLIPHARAEEKTLYAAVLQKSESDNPEEAENKVLEAYEEHAAVDMLLTELTEADPEAEEWLAKVQVLKENIEHHVKEEEEELFPKVQELMSEEALSILHEAFNKEKANFEDGLPSQKQISAKEISRDAQPALNA